ncbi:FecR family protein [Ensifer sp. MJa1]|uniref:FecR family protein n=1 Tax=Ensifer sp. MJa1 TaxID=2919888 RepID=UPI00300A2A8D
MKRHFASVLLLLLLTEPVVARDIGTAAAVQPTVIGEGERIIRVDAAVRANERIVTGAEGRAQLLFADGSAFSIGPGSDVVLDTFVYDPDRSTGKIALSVTKGVFRFVGGKLSKEQPVAISAGTATMGIRGGIAFLTVQPDQSVSAAFLYGEELTLRRNGVTRSTSKRGTAIDAEPGHAPRTARPLSAIEIDDLLCQFDRGPKKTDQLAEIPIDRSKLPAR